ncbi:MAG: hypothetical protein Q8O64_00755 [Sideroxyarcus sp.]|nr:hypothetical protein [Sideroxyarcus sp.]
MSEDADTGRFVKEPILLVELCREVIDQLDASSENTAVSEQEAQLRAIAKAVEQLEKSGVSVPDPLRAEKTRLVALLAMHTDAKQTLAQLAEEFQDILNDLRERLGQNTAAPEAKPRKRRSKLPKTPQKELRQLIICALAARGGRARMSEVLADLGGQLGGKLLPGDLVYRQDGKTIAWQNNACWERMYMRRDGVLRSDSPQGIWELSEDAQ